MFSLCYISIVRLGTSPKSGDDDGHRIYSTHGKHETVRRCQRLFMSTQGSDEFMFYIYAKTERTRNVLLARRPNTVPVTAKGMVEPLVKISLVLCVQIIMLNTGNE